MTQNDKQTNKQNDNKLFTAKQNGRTQNDKQTDKYTNRNRRALPLVTAKQNDTQQGKPKPVCPVEKVNKNQVGKNSCYSLY